MNDMANILIGIAGLILCVLVPAVGGLIGMGIKLWSQQAQHSTRLTVLEGNQTTSATILEQRIVALITDLERRIETKMTRMEGRLTRALLHQHALPELPEDDPDNQGRGG